MSPRPRKRFAQHWLRSEKVLNQIAAAAQLQPSDRLLEIGPGTGNLTRILLPQVAALTAVEIDRDLCKRLVQRWGDRDNFLLLQGNFLDLNLTQLLTDFPKFQNPNKVVANIPYNITGPILSRLLGSIRSPTSFDWEQIVLLVQKEVANRLTAIPGTKSYGALTVRVQYLADCYPICDVPARAFQPPPKVDSAVITLQPRQLPIATQNPALLETVIKLGFANRRKMLRNNLKDLIEGDRLCQLLEQLNISPAARAENLGLGEWIALCNHLNPLLSPS